jgi:hypothetical protein
MAEPARNWPFPTLLAAAGETTVKERLLKGWEPAGNPTTFRNHLDGYDQLDYLTGKTTKGARMEFAYFNDDGDLVAYRYGDWKAVFAEMGKPGGFAVWEYPFTTMRIPKLFNLRMDPYERADIVSDQYDDWRIKNAYLDGWLIWHAAAFLATFNEYPPSQRPASLRLIKSARMWTNQSKSHLKRKGINDADEWRKLLKPIFKSIFFTIWEKFVEMPWHSRMHSTLEAIQWFSAIAPRRRTTISGANLVFSSRCHTLKALSYAIAASTTFLWLKGPLHAEEGGSGDYMPGLYSSVINISPNQPGLALGSAFLFYTGSAGGQHHAALRRTAGGQH